MANGKTRACGWEKSFIKTQLNGLTGHIGACGFPFDRQFWGADPGEYGGTKWWPYEQTAYYIDGHMRAAIALGDEKEIEKISKVIYNVVLNPDEYGYIGPEFLRESNDRSARWPHVVFFRACMALYEYNGDERIVEALTKHYLAFPFDYAIHRCFLNIEIILWLYGINGNPDLLKLATEIYDSYEAIASEYYEKPLIGENGKENENWKICEKSLTDGKKLDIHGVSYNEFSKIGALMYRYTGRRECLEASERAFDKIRKYYILPGGCNSSSEYLISSDPYETYETCDSVDRTWSLGYLAKITDKGRYADELEECVFNAGIGATLEDFKGLQYFSGPNQIMLDEKSSHAWYMKGNKGMAYGPNPFTACCPGNVNRLLPDYIINQYHSDDMSVTCMLYGPSEYECDTENGHVKITQITDYPFSLDIKFKVESDGPVMFRTRIPRWAKSAEVHGGKRIVSGDYVVFSLPGSAELSVSFDAKIEELRSGTGVFFRRGPLVYSLGFKGTRSSFEVKEYDGESYPSYRMYPDGDWNYAIAENADPVFKEGTDSVWDLDCRLPSITVNAKKVTNWKLRKTNTYRYKSETGVTRAYGAGRVFTPRLPDPESMKYGEEERITLYPFGASKVRMTVLPKERR